MTKPEIEKLARELAIKITQDPDGMARIAPIIVQSILEVYNKAIDDSVNANCQLESFWDKWLDIKTKAEKDAFDFAINVKINGIRKLKLYQSKMDLI